MLHLRAGLLRRLQELLLAGQPVHQRLEPVVDLSQRRLRILLGRMIRISRAALGGGGGVGLAHPVLLEVEGAARGKVLDEGLWRRVL